MIFRKEQQTFVNHWKYLYKVVQQWQQKKKVLVEQNLLSNDCKRFLNWIPLGINKIFRSVTHCLIYKSLWTAYIAVAHSSIQFLIFVYFCSSVLLFNSAQFCLAKVTFGLLQFAFLLFCMCFIAFSVTKIVCLPIW